MALLLLMVVVLAVVLLLPLPAWVVQQQPWIGCWHKQQQLLVQAMQR